MISVGEKPLEQGAFTCVEREEEEGRRRRRRRRRKQVCAYIISFEKLFEFLHTLFHNFSLSSSTECEICKSILSSLNLEHTFFNRL